MRKVKLTPEKLRAYLAKLQREGLSPSIKRGKLSHVDKFLQWALAKNLIKQKEYKQLDSLIADLDRSLSNRPKFPTLDETTKKTKNQAGLIKERYIPFKAQTYKIKEWLNGILIGSSSNSSSPSQPAFNLQSYIGIALVFVIMSLLGGGVYTQFFQKPETPLGFPSELKRSGRIISFQGRLTDSLGNPITAATNVGFKFYNTSTGGSSLYDSSACSVTPDQDGIFDVLIGGSGYSPTSPQQVCGTELPSSLFSENANVYLGVTVGGDSEMSPRQQIANVGYALNAETLQGFPPGAETSNIPVINKDGNLFLSVANPGIRSTYASAAFTLSSAGGVVLQSGGSGDVTLNASQSGSLLFATGGSNRGTIDNSGNLGIGTTAPADLVHIAGGQLRIDNNTDATTKGCVRYNGTLNELQFSNDCSTFQSMAGAASAGGWTDDGTVVRLTTGSDNVTLGSTSDLAKLGIDGESDEIQFLVQGNATQTNNLIVAENSSGTDQFTVDNSGNVAVEGGISDISGNLVLNDQTDIGSATTGIRVTAAGAISDIDGNISLNDNTDITGDLSVSGGDITGVGSAAIDIGEATAGDVEITGDLLPATDDTYDLGSTTKSWQDLYLTGSLCFDDTDCISGSTSAGPWDSASGVVFLDTSTDNVTIGSTSNLAKLAVDGDTDEIQFLVQGNATQTSSLAVLENSLGTDQLTVSNTGDLAVEGNVSDISGNLVLNDVVDIGSATTGINVTTTGLISDIDGNVVIGDTVDLGSATTGVNVTTGGIISDTDGNVVIGDTVDLGSATTGINVTTTGVVTDTDGNVVIDDTVDLGSATTGLRIATTGSVSDIDGNIVLNDVVDIGSATTGLNVTTAGLVSDIDGNVVIGDTVDLGSATTGINVTTGGVISDNDGNISLNDNTDITGNLDVSGTLTSGTADAFTVSATGVITTITDETINGIDISAGAVSDVNDLAIVLGAANDVTIDAATTDNTTTSGVVDLNVDTVTNNNVGLNIDYVIRDSAGISGYGQTVTITIDSDAGNDSVGYGIRILGDSDDAGSTLYGLYIDADSDGGGEGTEYAAVFLDGNVGIGDTTPDAPLDVVGDVYISDGLSLFETAVSDGTIEATQFCTGDGETNCISDFSGSNAGPWNETTGVIHLDNSANNVTIGSSTNLAKLAVDGDTDEIQFLVQGNATQTSSLAVLEQSDGTDVLRVSNAGNLEVEGTISDIGGNLVLADTVDIGSASTGLNVTTAGLISDIDGNVVIGDTVDLGSATTGINVTTAGVISDSDGSVIVGDDFQVNGNTTLGDLNTADTLTGNLLTSSITSGATTQTAIALSGTGFTTGELLDMTGTWQASDGSDNEGVDINFTYTPTSTAGIFRGIDLNVAEGANALANTLYGVKVTSDNSANTSTGTHSIYGGHFTATGKTAGTTTAVGLYATATGADNNYAAIFENGNVGIGDTAPTAPLDVTGDIYVSSGLSTFQTAVSDGTIEATKFCTGDGETNCTTDFSAGGAGPWDSSGGVVFLDTSTNNVTVGSSSNLAKLGVDGDTDEIQFLVQGNATQTSSLAVLEQSDGTDVLRVSNAGNLEVEGTISDIGGNLVLADTVDIGSASTGLNVTTAGLISDIDGNVVIGDTVDLGSATTGINVTTTGVISDSDGNISLNDNTDIAGDLSVSGGDITGANGAALDLGEATSGDITVTGDLIVADNSFIGLSSSAGLIEFDDQTTDEVNILNANVGIGTNTPNTKLEVKLDSALATNNALRLSNTAGQNVGTGIVFYADTNPAGGGLFNSSRIYSAFDGATYATGQITLQNPTGADTWIDTLTAKNGQVGIGDTTPDAPLDVVGDLYVSDGISLFETAVSDGTVEATKFCTGDGETNCTSDFASLASSGSGWVDDGTEVRLNTSTDEVEIGSAGVLAAKLAVNGDADEIQLLIQGNATQTSSLAVFEQSDGTDVLTISNGGALTLEGTISDIGGNLVLDDTVDIGSATTGLRVATSGSVSDIDGNIVLNDVVDIGSATTGINVTTAGLVTDIDGNVVIGDTVDLGSATTGINVTTTGVISDTDGNVVIADTVDLGSATTGINVTTAGVITDTDGNIVLDDVVDIGSATTGINVTTAGVITDTDGTVVVDDDFQVNGNTTLGDLNTADTLTGNLLTSSITSGATTQTAVSLAAASLTTGEILDITSTSAPTDGSTNEAIDLNITHAPTAAADNFRSIDLDTVDGTALGNTIYGIDNTLTLTGDAAKTGIGVYSTVSSSSTTADTLAALDLASAVTGIITTGTRNVYGARVQPTAGSESTGGTTNVYGVYTGVSADVGAGGTVNGYGVYIANGTYDTDGTSTNIGLYVAEPTGADTNYAGIFADGNVGIGSIAPAQQLTVLQDDVADILGLYDGANNTNLLVADAGVTTFKPTAFDTVYNFNGIATYTNNTTEAKTNGGTAFTMLAAENPSDDIFYLGLDHPFPTINIDIAVAGSGVTLVKEYWNGSAWTALTVTDNTTNFTTDGTITFTAPTDWAANSVNSVSKYWVRFCSKSSGDCSTGTGTNLATAPTANFVSPTTGNRFYAYGQSGDASAALYINDFGYIGMGTNTPEALLEVQGREGADATLALDADDGDDATDTWFISALAGGSNALSILNDTTEVLNLSTGGNLQIDGDLILSGADILDSNGNESLRFSNAASAVNEITIGNAATGNGVTLAATGGDTDVALSIDAKGAGALNLNNTGTGDVLIAGGAAGTGCTITNATGNITCARFIDATGAGAYYLDPADATTSLSIAGDITVAGGDITTGGNIALHLRSGTSTTNIKAGASGGNSSLCVTYNASADGACDGKIDAGTVDPPYTINGQKYATYLSAMTGVKEETTGKVNVIEYVPGIGYRYVIDFAQQPEGSDLWLFSKTAELKNNIASLVPLLTPSSNTRVWYMIDEPGQRLIIYTSRPTTVAYRLTAPRFDSEHWANTRDEGGSGFIINDEGNVSGGDLPVQQAESFSVSKEENQYIVRDGFNQIMQEVGAFSKATFGSVTTGAITVQEVATNTLSATAGSIQTLSTDTLSAVNATIDNLTINYELRTTKLLSPVVETGELKAENVKTDSVETNIVRPKDKNVIIDLSHPEQSEGSNGGDSSATPQNDNGPLAKLIIRGRNGSEVASINSEGDIAARNATLSGTLAAENLQAKDVYTEGLIARSASLSGKLIADEVDSRNIREFRDRLENTVSQTSNLSQQTNTVSQQTSNLSSQVNEIQSLLAQLQNQPLPDPNYYQNLDPAAVTGIVDSQNNLILQQYASVATSNLAVSGTANLYDAYVVNNFGVGSITIKDDQIMTLASELKINALETINLLDGAVVIAKDGTITTKGTLIAQGGVKTNELKPLTDQDNIGIDLTNQIRNSKFEIRNSGNAVASIDASGAAQFKNLSLDSSLVASDSGSIIAAADNFTRNGLFGVAIETNAESAGLGIIPTNEQEIIIYNKNIKDNSLIYLTPTGSVPNGQLTVSQKQSCPSGTQGCKAYFKVSIGNASHPDLKFNWLIIN